MLFRMLDSAIILIYFVIVFGIGIYHSGRQNTATVWVGLLSARRCSPLTYPASTLFASPDQAPPADWPSDAMSGPPAFACFSSGGCLCRIILRSQVYTMPEFLERRDQIPSGPRTDLGFRVRIFGRSDTCIPGRIWAVNPQPLSTIRVPGRIWVLGVGLIAIRSRVGLDAPRCSRMLRFSLCLLWEPKARAITMITARAMANARPISIDCPIVAV
jgi:hypothetical protein